MRNKPSDLTPGVSGVSAAVPRSPLQEVEDAAPRSVVAKVNYLEAAAAATAARNPQALAWMFQDVGARVQSGELAGEAGQAVAGSIGAAWEQTAAAEAARAQRDDPALARPESSASVPRHVETARQQRSTVDLTDAHSRPAAAASNRPAAHSPAQSQAHKLVNPPGFFK